MLPSMSLASLSSKPIQHFLNQHQQIYHLIDLDKSHWLNMAVPILISESLVYLANFKEL